MKRSLLLPHIIQIICNVYLSVSLWSINWEFGVEPLGCLTTLEALLAVESKVKGWRPIRTVIGHPVIQAESSLHFLGTGNSRSDAVDLAPDILFGTYAT